MHCGKKPRQRTAMHPSEGAGLFLAHTMLENTSVRTHCQFHLCIITFTNLFLYNEIIQLKDNWIGLFLTIYLKLFFPLSAWQIRNSAHDTVFFCLLAIILSWLELNFLSHAHEPPPPPPPLQPPTHTNTGRKYHLRRDNWESNPDSTNHRPSIHASTTD